MQQGCCPIPAAPCKASHTYPVCKLALVSQTAASMVLQGQKFSKLPTLMLGFQSQRKALNDNGVIQSHVCHYH